MARPLIPPTKNAPECDEAAMAKAQQEANAPMRIYVEQTALKVPE
ncbi:MAG: hypothetical protein P4L90_19675 [Rhodopila sp.]|nr:hypothetical protein [Rhodopila sp.]